jgi:Mrp family chromosome partitioning ATPase
MNDTKNETNRSRRIYWVVAASEAWAKSMITVARLDHLLERGAKVLLVECDMSNPDVWKAYREQGEAELIELDEADGCIHSSTRARGTARSWW